MSDVSDLPLVTKPSESYLNQRQLLEYRSEREECLRWLLAFGKNPDKDEGYSETTIDQLTHQFGSFYRWVWEQERQYTTKVTPDHADAYMKEIAYGDTTNGHKSTVMKCLKRLFKYRR